ncbi:hypothetical protein GCM10027064_20800 [Microbacterium petrolearium]|jgi:hypothetical protein
MTREQPRAWSAGELAALDDAPLIRLAPERADGSLAPAVPVGHVRLGSDELVRSLNVTAGAWYRAATRSGRGRIEVGRRRIAVRFIPDTGREAEIDGALRSRYGDDAGVRAMTRPPARDANLRIVPID